MAIWEERKVFGMSGAKPFTELVEAAGTPKKAPGIPPRPHHPGACLHLDSAQGSLSALESPKCPTEVPRQMLIDCSPGRESCMSLVPVPDMLKEASARCIMGHTEDQ